MTSTATSPSTTRLPSLFPDDDTDGTISGTFLVSDYENDNADVPATAFGLDLSAFNGEDANGAWSLYIYDETAG